MARARTQATTTSVTSHKPASQGLGNVEPSSVDSRGINEPSSVDSSGMKFICDVMLEGLARQLRLYGIDAASTQQKDKHHRQQVIRCAYINS
jgi:hypothetical protein